MTSSNAETGGCAADGMLHDAEIAAGHTWLTKMSTRCVSEEFPWTSAASEPNVELAALDVVVILLTSISIVRGEKYGSRKP